MLAKDDTFMNEAAQSLYECNSDDLIQEQCRARETRLFFERATQAKLVELTEALAAKDAALTEKDATLTEKDAQIDNLLALLKEHNINI